MLIGEIYTRAEVDEFRKKQGIRETRFRSNRYSIGRDEYVFSVDGDDYMLVETRESRLEDMDDRPNIHRKEMKYRKHYYDTRKF